MLDSAFADLSQLAEELVDKARDSGLTVPSFVISILLRMIKSSVQKTAGFNISDLSPIAHVDACFKPSRKRSGFTSAGLARERLEVC